MALKTTLASIQADCEEQIQLGSCAFAYREYSKIFFAVSAIFRMRSQTNKTHFFPNVLIVSAANQFGCAKIAQQQNGKWYMCEKLFRNKLIEARMRIRKTPTHISPDRKVYTNLKNCCKRILSNSRRGISLHSPKYIRKLKWQQKKTDETMRSAYEFYARYDVTV